jgi:hypothetical protein
MIIPDPSICHRAVALSLGKEFRFLALDSRMPIAGSFAPCCILGLPSKKSEF